MRKINIFVIFMMGLFAIAPTWSGSSGNDITQPEPKSGFQDMLPGETDCAGNVSVVTQEKSRGPYTVKISRDPEFFCEILEIQENGVSVFQDFIHGGHFWLGLDDEQEQPFQSVLGFSSQNILISTWTGGAHCCYSVRIFDTKNGLREIFRSEFSHYQPSLIDLDHDGIFEIEAYDDFLTEQFSSFSESAVAKIFLKYDGERYVIALEYMQKPSINFENLENEIAQWRKEIEEVNDLERMPYEFMQTLTHQIYSGHKDIAFELIDRVWPLRGPSKDEFIHVYNDALHDSQFYGQVVQALAEQN